MSLAISENFGDLLTPIFEKIYQNEIEKMNTTDYIPQLFGMKTSTKSTLKMSGMGAMGDVPAFTGQLEYDSFGQLYDKSYTFPERALGFQVSRKLYDDDEYGIMDQKPVELATAVHRTRQKAGAAFLINSFTATSGNADGVALCSSSHPYSPDDSTTLDNAGTSALTAVSVEATRRIGLTGIKNDRGELVDINYDTIWVPPALEEKAYQIVHSLGQVDTANNNVNFNRDRYKIMVWNRLTSATNWWMVDAQLAKTYFLWVDRVKPEFNNDKDFDTFAAKYSVYYRATCGHHEWRPIYGHLVS